MPNTTNYSFPTPADTDLVKNGADAIRDLGDAVDTAMNTALGTKKAGMVLLNTTSFSAVSSQSINDVFSTTYNNYKLIFVGVCSTAAGLRFRGRVSGADNSTSNYFNQVVKGNNTTVEASRESSQTSSDIGEMGTNTSSISLDIFSPFLTAKTQISGLNEVGLNVIVMRSGGFNDTTSFTGFTVFPASGTITGTITIYGYNK
jgi:hypothetical protein